MPVSTLVPNSTTDLGGCLVGGGAPNAHTALTDGSDVTDINAQISQFEPAKRVRGGLSDLPVGVGLVSGVVMNVRAYRSTNLGDSCALYCGEFPNVRLSPTLSGVVAAYSSASFLPSSDPAVINAMEFMTGVQYVDHDGTQGFVTAASYDVTYEFVHGVAVSIMFALGPLVAVGLLEMPRLNAWLYARTRTRFLEHELLPAWRALREDRRRRYFVLPTVDRCAWWMFQPVRRTRPAM